MQLVFLVFKACYLVIWLFGYLVIWLFDYLIIWLFGYLVIWLSGYLVIFFYRIISGICVVLGSKSTLGLSRS